MDIGPYEFSGGGSACLILIVVSAIVFLTMIGMYLYHAVIFEMNCEGYLDRAAHANTIEKASVELDIAIQYIESRGLTKGYTSVLYRTPDEDMGFWYDNLKKSYHELQTIKPDASQLEKSNVLMKLRETLEYKPPCGISIYPNNGIMMLVSWMAFLILFGLIIASPLIDP